MSLMSSLGSFNALSSAANGGSFAPFDSSYSFSGGAGSLVPSFGAGDFAAAGAGAGAGIGAAGGMAGALGPISAGISAVQSLANMWMGFKQMKMAQKQFKFEKKMTVQNLLNQMQSYNTALADRARSRGVMEGQSADQVADYIRSNSLYRGDANKGKTAGMVNDTIAASLNNYNAISGGHGDYNAPAGAVSNLAGNYKGGGASAPAPAAGGGGINSFSALASRGSAERGPKDEEKTAG